VCRDLESSIRHAFRVKILGIHHVTVAVRDLDAAAATFAQMFGATVDQVNVVPAFGVRSADITLGDSTFQLASAADPDNAFARFVERKGEGFYNLALEVEDLDAAVRELQHAGVRMSEPLEATPGVRSAFIAMATTHGLSIQLVQTAHRRPTAPDPPAPASQPSEPIPLPAPQDEPVVSADDDPDKKILDLTPDEWSDVD
jgi:methylmalonyl-CoA/ethylmalonyl-CoA epimerase